MNRGLLILNTGDRWVGVGGWGGKWSTLHPEKKSRQSLYRRMGGPQGRSGRVRQKENNVPSVGFELRTVQSVANRYTDCGTTTQFPVRVRLDTDNILQDVCPFSCCEFRGSDMLICCV